MLPGQVSYCLCQASPELAPFIADDELNKGANGGGDKERYQIIGTMLSSRLHPDLYFFDMGEQNCGRPAIMHARTACPVVP